MRNRGYITVFLCLIVSAMLVLVTAAMNIAGMFAKREQSAMAFRLAASSVLAEYNPYIFEKYHILCFDSSWYGQGEALTEEKLSQYLEENIKGGQSIEELSLSNVRYITDDNCRAFKNQIAEYMKYAAVDYGVDTILEKTGGRDGAISDELSEELIIAKEDESPVPEETEETEDENPREFTKKYGGYGMLSILAPEGKEYSSEYHYFEDLPSGNKLNIMDYISSFNNDFEDYDEFSYDMNNDGVFMDSLMDAGAAVIYARLVFNSAVNSEKNENTVFEGEMEYLISGLPDDYDNIQCCCMKIIAIRVPVNFAYLVTDAAKMSQVKAISVPIAAVTVVIPEIAIRYLIAGAWSYVEAMAEVRTLLNGEKQPFIKSADTWQTSLKNIGSSLLNAKGYENGLSYEDYLVILLALSGDTIYLRMLDLMDMNARQEETDFRMKNAAVELSADLRISLGIRDFYYSLTLGY